MRTRWSVLALALLLSACDQSGAQPSAGELDAYCAVARRGDVATWVGDVLTLCQSDGSEDGVTCQAARPSVDGVEPFALGDVSALRVFPASGGRFVVLGADSRLSVVRSDGSEERELAAWATDPWVSDDGQRAAWIGLPEGVAQWDFGVPTVVVVQDLRASGQRTVLAEDELASTPRPIPGTSDVLYVSAQTGLASFWVAGTNRAPEQLTNIGLTEIGQETVPVADREIAWDGTTLFYSVPGDDGARLWRLDVASADARELGPGAWPRPHGSSIIALAPGGESCAVVYTNGGAP